MTIIDQSVSKNVDLSAISRPAVSHQLLPHTDHCSDAAIQDFHDPDKLRCFLAHEPTVFQFIGPDSQPVTYFTIEDYIMMANTIRSTNLPNKVARYPIHLGLNIDVWRRYLCIIITRSCITRISNLLVPIVIG